jgi:hypothetical protein
MRTTAPGAGGGRQLRGYGAPSTGAGELVAGVGSGARTVRRADREEPDGHAWRGGRGAGLRSAGRRSTGPSALARTGGPPVGPPPVRPAVPLGRRPQRRRCRWRSSCRVATRRRSGAGSRASSGGSPSTTTRPGRSLPPSAWWTTNRSGRAGAGRCCRRCSSSTTTPRRRRPRRSCTRWARRRPAVALGRDQLPEVVDGLLRRPTWRAAGPRVLRVGGAAGGVGTTTVALALAGLLGWQGDGTLALVRPPAAVPALRVVPGEAVGAADLWARADELPAVPRGRVLGIVGGEVPVPADPRIVAAVIDAGVDDDVDVLVCRPDAAGLAGLAATTAAAVVLVGPGRRRPRTWCGRLAAAGGRRAVVGTGRPRRAARPGPGLAARPLAAAAGPARRPAEGRRVGGVIRRPQARRDPSSRSGPGPVRSPPTRATAPAIVRTT